jgi:hypothetical protein
LALPLVKGLRGFLLSERGKEINGVCGYIQVGHNKKMNYSCEIIATEEHFTTPPFFDFFTTLKNQLSQTNINSCHEKNHSIYICARKHTMHN